jgi:hypothetical protein
MAPCVVAMIAVCANFGAVSCHEGTMQIIGLTMDMSKLRFAAKGFDQI